ncbi:MAG: alpha-L-arabinofuranosidase, partial [Bacteroides heparinolyticus]|nr:alpha-L-arabinofuranosidase [Bacteroides heparinolyticus]
MRKYTGLLAAFTFAASVGLQAQTNELVVQTKRVGAEIQPTMYGLFFEDINYAADGGLYAELVKNRSFEFPQNL